MEEHPGGATTPESEISHASTNESKPDDDRSWRSAGPAGSAGPEEVCETAGSRAMEDDRLGSIVREPDQWL